MPSPIVLVDGSSYLFRAFHAIPPLSNSKGLQTNAIKGVISMIKRLQKDYPSSQMIVVFDAKGKTFRNEIYDQYKANRPPMPDELRPQIEPIHNIIKAMGLPLLSIEGVEADDVIGTLAHQANEKGLPAIISTGDKDMAQLVNDNITLINTMNNSELDTQGVQEKYGVPPKHIVDYLALMGDASDNIPGVPKVGEKTAQALVAGLGSLEDIYANLEGIKSLSFRGAKTLAPKMEEFKEQAFLSKNLATIRTEVDLPYSLEDIKNQPEQTQELAELYAELEFKGWLDELGSSDTKMEPTNEPNHTVNYQTIFTQSELDTWLERLKNSELFAFDTETTSLNYKQARIVGVSFATTPFEAAYVPLAHDYEGAPEQLNLEDVLNQLKPLLEDANQAKVGQHMKYDAHVLNNHGITLSGVKFDTQLESYCLNSVATSHGMDALAQHYLEHKTTHFEDIAGKGVKQKTFNQIAIEEAAPYAAEDADITLRLHLHLLEKLKQEPELHTLFETLEMPLMQILANIEDTGVLIDSDLLFIQSQEITQRLEELEHKAHELAGKSFNLGSTKQLGEVLFDILELPIIKKTPKGKPSTAEEVLQELANDYELPKLILEHRSLAKLKSTYTDKLPQMLDSQTQRVHTSYHQAVTATGRLSSSDPNLQNIPIRSEEGRRIRQAFIAEKGKKIVAADYSQIELRIMAHLSHDDGLLNAFKEDKDVHKATAAEVFGVTEGEVTQNQRRSAKAINFGLIYGMSAFGLARQLGIGRNQAQEYVDLYFARYPGVKQYMDNTREQAREQGYVKTLFNRRLYLPEINAKNGMRRQHAERTAINAPMQGTAADIIKQAMIDVDAWLKQGEFDARMIMQVHDELVFEVAEDQADEFAKMVSQKMQQAAKLDVPLLVEAGIGDNWDEAH